METSIINLLSTDVAKFECLFYCIPYIVMLPLQVIATFYFIWQSVGFCPAIVGITLVIIQTLPMKGVKAVSFFFLHIFLFYPLFQFIFF